MADLGQRELFKVAMFCRLSSERVPEEEIASKLGFGSAEAMRAQLDNWGVGGLVSGGPPRGDTRQGRRPGAGGGRSADKPPAGRAAALFRERLQALLADVEDLEHRHDARQDGRFVARRVYQDPVWFSRKVFSDERWRDLCEEHNQDPDAEGFMVLGVSTVLPEGAGPSPPEPLSALVGVYALAGGQMEPLLGALYPGTPPEHVLREIGVCVSGKKKTHNKDGLKTVARQLATLVYGEKAVGAPRPSLSAAEHDAACYITYLRESGMADGAILEKLRNHTKADGSALTMEDLLRLGSLRLRYG